MNNDVFDEYGNYKFPTDVVLDEPNNVIATTEIQEKEKP